MTQIKFLSYSVQILTVKVGFELNSPNALEIYKVKSAVHRIHNYAISEPWFHQVYEVDNIYLWS